MVNFKSKNVILFGLGLLLSINSFGMKPNVGWGKSKKNEPSLGATKTETVQPSLPVIDPKIEEIREKFQSLYKNESKSPLMLVKEKKFKEYFEETEVIELLATVSFSGEGNILFQSLMKDKYGDKKEFTLKDRVEFFKFFIDILKKDEKNLKPLVNQIIRLNDGSSLSLFNLITDKDFSVERKKIENILFDCKDVLNKKILNCKNTKVVSYFSFIYGLEKSYESQEILAKVVLIPGIALDSSDLKAIFNGKMEKKENLILKFIHNKQFKLVKDILNSVDKKHVDKIDFKEFILSDIITSMGYKKHPESVDCDVNRRPKDKAVFFSEVKELMELLLDKFNVKVDFADEGRYDRAPIAHLSRLLEGSLLKLEAKGKPVYKDSRRIRTEDAIGLLDILLSKGVALRGYKDKEMDKKEESNTGDFCSWLVCDIKESFKSSYKNNKAGRGDFESSDLFKSRIKLLKKVYEPYKKKNPSEVKNNTNPVDPFVVMVDAIAKESFREDHFNKIFTAMAEDGFSEENLNHFISKVKVITGIVIK